MRREPSPGFQTHHLDRPTGGPTGTAGTTRPALGSCSPPNLPPAPSLPPWGPRPPSPPDPCRLTPRLRAAGGPHGSVSPPSVSKQALLLQEPPRGLGHAAGREGQLGQPGQPLSPSTPPLKHSCRSEALSPPLAGHPPPQVCQQPDKPLGDLCPPALPPGGPREQSGVSHVLPLPLGPLPCQGGSWGRQQSQRSPCHGASLGPTPRPAP